ncbi:MAG: 4Fe-4S binding protein [Chitinophagales bacterium]
MIKIRKQKWILLIALICMLLVVTPAFAGNYCPKGKVNCMQPCRDYMDTNGNGICDLSESSTGTSGSNYGMDEPETYYPGDSDTYYEDTMPTYQEELNTNDSYPVETTESTSDTNTTDSESASSEVTESTDNNNAADESIETSKVRDDGGESEASGDSDTESIEEQTSTENTEDSQGILAALFDPQFLVLLLLLVLALVAVRRKLPWYIRLLILAAGLGYLGFYLKGCICPVGVLANLPLRLQGIIAGEFNLWLLLFLVPIVFAIFAGRIFCGGVCPFGAVQEFMFKLGTRLGLNKARAGLESVSWLKYLKYIFLLAVLVITPLTGVIWWCKIDPFGCLFNLSGTWYASILLIVLLALSMFISRLWCRFICPYGALLGIVAKDAGWLSGTSGGPSIDKEVCRKCGRCEKNCPVAAVKKGVIDEAECINCGNCSKECKLGAVRA